ncbi:antibiotic biosynthesis monooxygenase [Antribacter sp. KLBMP9083]|uniref:Antibiotic biosynthesis monooxygenase n=1 Tax=Antribacter soli TaxID=2910976 RepID=A0AA41U7F4_9MICO|nr:antibiotic biosynthesis monooxygenase [Antribacter soli]MCF4121305.1 antibiotic biosynthesis monooxygenase [Antribacter soli]
MYVRTTEVRGDPARIDDGLRLVREEIYPAVSAMDGCAGMSLLVDRQTGRCIATTSWRSEDAMLANVGAVRPLRERVEQSVGSTSGSQVHQWEVAVVHRDHAAPDGACARLTWLNGDPSMMDRAIDVYRMAILPQIQELDGFCSSSLMVDRETGRVAGTVAFDSRRALEASRDAAMRIREQAVRELGATIDDVEEMEIAFAHLHVPEMA